MATKIKALADRGGGVASPYGLSYYIHEKRHRLYFRTEEERDAKMKELRVTAAEVGEQGMAVSREDVLMLERCREVIPEDVSLIEVCRWWARKHRAIEPMDIPTAAELFGIYRQRRGISAARIRNGDTVLETFGGSFSCEVGEFSEQMLSDWLLGLPYEPATVKSYRDHLKSFFEYCTRQGWSADLDFDRVDRVRVPKKSVIFMEVAQVAALMKYAWKHQPRLCGILALGFFGGLRTSSIERLRPADIKFEDRGIELPPENTKTGERFYIDSFPDVLWVWLEAVHARIGNEAFRISKEEWDRWRPILCGAVGIDWPHNCMRKTFTTYLVAATGNESEVATILTHTNVRQLKKQYKGKAKKADGLKYLQIKPAKKLS